MLGFNRAFLNSATHALTKARVQFDHSVYHLEQHGFSRTEDLPGGPQMNFDL